MNRMNLALRASLVASTALCLSVPAMAAGHGYVGGFHGGTRFVAGHGGWHGGGGYRGGWGGGPLLWGTLGLGIGLAAAYGPWYYGPDYVVVPQQTTVVVPGAVAAPVTVAPAMSSSAAVEPVIYPRNGQSAAQLEADKQVCVQWAVAQPRALADGSVYQRALAACMDGRGYTLR